MEVLDIKTIHRWGPINICPLGDIQAGIKACDIGLLKETIAQAVDNDCYFIGMGDYLDVASPSNRSRFANAGLYDSFHDFMEDHMREEEEKLIKILNPTKDRWLGWLHGHHLWEYRDGSTTDTHMSDALGGPYLGTSAMIRLFFRKGNKEAVCTIHATHGVGSGDPLRKLSSTASWMDADLFLMGHYHKRQAITLPRMSVVGERGSPVLVDTERKLICTGSYLRGYMQGSTAGALPHGGYVEEAMLQPVSLGSPMVRITPYMEHGVGRVHLEVVS